MRYVQTPQSTWLSLSQNSSLDTETVSVDCELVWLQILSIMPFETLLDVREIYITHCYKHLVYLYLKYTLPSSLLRAKYHFRSSSIGITIENEAGAVEFLLLEQHSTIRLLPC